MLATATPDGAPSARMVLLKQWDERGFVVFTNYESRKGAELAANPRAALLFYWDLLGRQVRIEGGVARTTAEESAAYVRTRPLGSQLSALASPQSQPVPNREALRSGWPSSRRATRVKSLPCPNGGVGFASCRTVTSSGSTGRTASTTVCSIGAMTPAAGGSSAWRPERVGLSDGG